MEIDPNKKQARPSFPQLTLQKAVQLARKVFEHEPGPHAILEDHFLNILGYNKQTGNFIRDIASLRGYDLVSRRTGGYALTDRSVKLFTTDSYSSFRIIVIEMAKMPKILYDLMKLFAGDFYSDEFQSELIKRGFISRGAATIQNVLKDNWALINEEKRLDILYEEVNGSQKAPSMFEDKFIHTSGNHEILSFNTIAGTKISVSSNGPISARDIEKLKAMLDIYMSDLTV